MARVAVTTAVLAAATIGTGIVQTSATTPAGGALTFDGVNDYVTMGVAPSLAATNFTLEAWINRNPTGGVATSTGGAAPALTSAYPILTKGRGESDNPASVNLNYFLGIDTATGRLVADIEDTVNGGNHSVTGVAAVPTASWHHVAATYNGQTWRLYIDGVLDQTLTLATPFAPESTSVQHAAVG